MGRLKLGQMLVNRGLLDPDHLRTALADQKQSGARLGTTLVRMGFVDEETLIRTLAGQLKLPVARIRGKRVSRDVLACVPVALAEEHRCLPLFFKQEPGGRVLFVAMEDPSDTDAIDAIARASGEAPRAVLVGPTELEEALQRHYHWASLTGESPEWLSDRSSGEGTAPGDSGPGPEEPDEAPEDDSDPLGAALLPQSPWPDDADTAPELPEKASFEPGIILRALSQLLVEKGVLSRDELVQRLGELAARKAGRG